MSLRQFCHVTVLICLSIPILGDVVRSQETTQQRISHDQENSNIGDLICGPKCVLFAGLLRKTGGRCFFDPRDAVA